MYITSTYCTCWYYWR